MTKRAFIMPAVASALHLTTGGATAQDTFNSGLILPITGPFAPTGQQIEAAARL